MPDKAELIELENELLRLLNDADPGRLMDAYTESVLLRAVDLVESLIV